LDNFLRSFRLAVIDLGTNSIRFDVHQIQPDLTQVLIHREKWMVRLGEQVFLTQKLNPKARVRTVHALQSFSKTMQVLGVQKVLAFGTSALRDAKDSKDFLNFVKKNIGIQIKVISGLEEAKWIAHGILKHEKQTAHGKFLLVDIGGGSTEISYCSKGKLIHSRSFDLGVARLQQIFLKTSPPAKGSNSVDELRRHIRNAIEKTWKSWDKPSAPKLLGSSGTVRTLTRVAKKMEGMKSFDLEFLKGLTKKLSKLSYDEIRKIPGMDPKRTDLILAGTLLLEEIVRIFKVKEVIATEISLRDGILDREVKKFNPNSLPLKQSVFLRQLSLLGQSPKKSLQIWQTSSLLFDKLFPLHHLSDYWKACLAFASLYRDSALFTSTANTGKHSSYIVRQSHLPLSESQIQLVEELLRSSPDDRIIETDISVEIVGHPHLRKQFEKAFCLLKLGEIFSETGCTPRKIKVSRKQIEINVPSGCMDLAKMHLISSQEYIQKTLKKKIAFV